MNDPLLHRRPRSRSLPARLLGFVASIALLLLAAMFSLVALAVVAIGGAGFAGWLWWKTRALRRQMRGMAAAGPSPAGAAVIDGEWVREDGPTSGRRLR